MLLVTVNLITYIHVCDTVCLCVCGKLSTSFQGTTTGVHTGCFAYRPLQQAGGQQCPARPQIIAMAQAYYPSRTVSPVKPALHESVFGGLHDKQLNVEDVQEAYVESKDR